MRRGLVYLVLLAGGAAWAAGGPGGGKSGPASAGPDTAALRQESLQFAQALNMILEEVHQGYVRPMPRAALAVAALEGLYEAAHVSPPAGLRAGAEAAEKADQLAGFLARTRQELGVREELQGPKGLLACCQAVVRGLDPYCAVVSGQELRRGTPNEQNSGVGLELADNLGVGPLVIKGVVPGGPAQRAGLRGGDQIVQIDGKEARGLPVTQALVWLNSGLTPGSVPHVSDVTVPSLGSVRLTVRREGRPQSFDVTLVRQTFQAEMVLGVGRESDNSWDYWLDRKRRIALVRLAGLGHDSADELRRVMAGLDGGAGLKGLVLDLRWCPGGFLTEAVGVAGLFLEGGEIASVQSRQEQGQTYRAGEMGVRYPHVPLVVLINGETSGGAELVAAALQDHRRAAVIGQRTRGKASIQTILYVPIPGTGLKLTSGTFSRPSGENLHRFPDSGPNDPWGVRPDPGQERRASPELTRQLQQWWQDLTVRPGAAREMLPLDDAGADPQLQAAVRVLKARMDAKKTS